MGVRGTMRMEINYKTDLRPCRWKWHVANATWDCGVLHMFFPGGGRVGAVLETGNGEVIVVHDITALALQFTDGLAGETFDLASRPQGEETE
jgi:hypothetical protein